MSTRDAVLASSGILSDPPAMVATPRPDTVADDRASARASLRFLHRTSALLLLAFLALHLANHLAALAGQATHIAVMAALRPLYRNALVEPVLVALFVLQTLSGLTMVVRGWRRRRGGVAWLQAVSGLYLAVFLLNHVGSVLYGRHALGLDTDFHFAAAGFRAGLGGFFAPYYALAIAALFTHLGCAVYWRIRDRRPRPAVALLSAACIAGVVLGLLIVAALSGLLYPVDIPPRYLNTYR